ncbi:hypothetical protein ACVQ8P_05440 [Dellaglioa sp. BT-FLS60]
MKRKLMIFFFVGIGIMQCAFAIFDNYDLFHKIGELFMGLLALFIGYVTYDER